MDEHGGSLVSYAVPGVVFGFPAWSPEGSRIAAVGYGPDDTSIYVFTVQRGGGSGHADPVVIYRSPDRPPFYLYWTPDGRKLGFLATESAGISLRIAPADGSAPLDGSGPGAVIRQGAPLYFDWEGADRLLLHVGSGSGAFVGEVGLDGTAVAPAVPGSGNFRSASVSRDGRYLAYVRSVTDSSGEIVVASRDGASRQDLAVFGPAAFVFDPTGDTIASIAADKPVKDALAFPLGPLRLIDARSGSVRTLLDGSVVGFFWAPDGRTIAALRLARPGDKTADTGAVLTGAAMARPAAAATPPPSAEVRIAFVDVSTGVVRSERVVRLASHFVSELLPYFDQYALSHRLWSPDSASILLPLIDAIGRTRLVLVPANGTDSPPVVDGVSGFWSP
jgi:WD40-like Beta Propeller Repeat.